jgi:CHAD domain-containing protein
LVLTGCAFRSNVGPEDWEKMAFRFDIPEALDKAIPRIARERIGRIIESLSEKPQPGAESIHEARKDLKSIRALLRLARGSIDGEIRLRENTLFRDAGRSLSAIRDPQALLEALKYFSNPHRSNPGPSTEKQEAIRAFIAKIRVEIEEKLVDGLPPGVTRRLVKELRQARRRVALWFEGVPLPPGHEWEMFVGTGLRRTYRKAKNLVWQFEVIGHDTADDQTWHELRKSAKALGYQLRLLKPIWPGMMDAILEEIDQLTDRLGDANDLAILRAKILNEPYNPTETQESSETRRIFLQLLDHRKKKLQLDAFALARLIYAERPRQFERRLAGYWQIWRSRGEVKGPRRTSAGSQRRPPTGPSNPEILASSAS